MWKPLDGDPQELQNPAQSAKGEERWDRERNPWLAIVCKDDLTVDQINANQIIVHLITKLHGKEIQQFSNKFRYIFLIR